MAMTMSHEGLRRSGNAEIFPSNLAGAGHDIISNLPAECTTHIFSFLPSPRDRCSCTAVSRKWLLLLAFMRPCDFQSIPMAPGPSPLSAHCNDGNNEPEVAKGSRLLRFSSSSDAGLAAMAVGTCALRAAVTNLTIRALFFTPPSGSSLLCVTDGGLKIISRAFPHLRHVSLLGCTAVGNEGLAVMAGGCPALVQLYLFHGARVGDAGLVAVAMNCPKLSILSLTMCHHVGDEALHAFARYSPNLEFLSLDDCPLMGDAGLAAVLSSAPRLAKVNIAFMSAGDAALDAVAARGGESPMLSLSMENVSGFTRTGFRRLLQAAKLDSLLVRCCSGLDDAALSGIGGASGNGAVLAGPGVFVGLRRVAVRNCEGFTDDGLILLSESARHLAKLRLEKCHRVTTRGITIAIRNCSGTLKLLSLVRCNSIGTPQQQQEDVEEPALSLNRRPNLQSLMIKNCREVGDKFLSLVGCALGRAKRVELVGMRGVTDRGLVSLLASMHRRDGLRLVDLRGCRRITDWSVVALVGASGGSLSRLTLRRCVKVTDQSLRVIGQLCPVLEELDLSGCRRVGDGGVSGLLTRGTWGPWTMPALAGAHGDGARKNKLDMLSLEGCEGVTDRSLKSLAAMVMYGSLEWVNLRNCPGVSLGGVEALRRAFSRCDFVY